jgi:ATP-dependent Lon protease
MAMAMLSAISGIPASNNIAMTGEITLTGSILAIGGLNEKLLAAKRNDIKTILIPKDNEIDLKEMPEKVKEGLKIIPIAKLEEAIPYVFPDMKKVKAAQKQKPVKNRKKK